MSYLAKRRQELVKELHEIKSLQKERRQLFRLLKRSLDMVGRLSRDEFLKSETFQFIQATWPKENWL